MSYVEIVFAREALLKALVSKERSQIVREMKRAKKLGDNSLDLLLNAAHIFLSLLVKTHKGEKEIKSLQHALLEQEDVSKKRLQEIKEENQIKTRETREELKALKIGYADQASKLTEATRSLQRQCEVKSLTNGTFMLTAHEKQHALQVSKKYEFALVEDNKIYRIYNPFNFKIGESFEANDSFVALPNDYTVKFKLEKI